MEGRIIYRGSIDCDFNGFDGDSVFKMSNGTYWIQDQYQYWYHYEYRPKAIITEEYGRYILTVAGRSVYVKQLFDVVESSIDGEFRGWDGNSKYRLTNGQVWQQSEYKYEYMYSYRPEVMICNVNGSYIMFVEGTQATVKRI